MADRALRFDLLGRDRTLGRSLGQAEGKLSRFSRNMGRLAVVGGAAFAGLGAAAGLMGVKTLASLEQAEVGFTQLLGSGKKAQKFIGDLKRFAAKTPFELPGLIEAARGLLGAGKAARDVIPSLRAWGDAAGALGINQEAFGRVMLAVTQIMNKGKVQAEELLQITEAGIPIYPLLAKALHKPVPEIQKLGEQGKLLAKDVLPALEAQMAKDYGGSMAKQSKTLSGLWSTLMDTLNIGLADVLRPFEDEMKTGLTAAIKVAGDAFSALPRVVGRVFGPKGIIAAIDLKAIKLKLEGFAEPLIATAKGWTRAIIVGFQVGLKSGDWSQLGAILGNILRTAVGNGIDLIKRAFGGVDWFKVGKEATFIAVPFALGFFDSLLDALWKGAKEHPGAAIGALLAVLGPIGKAGGVIARVLAKIPFLRVFAPLFRGLESVTAPLRKAAGKLGGLIGQGLREGMERVFPTAAKTVRGRIGDLGAWISLRAEAFRKLGARMIRLLAAGIGQEVAQVVKDIGRVIAAITRPFRGAAGWLIRHGIEAISGLVRGIASMLGSVGAWIGRIISRVTSPFRGAAGWLIGRGRDLVSGLVSGIRSAIGSVGGVLRSLKDAIVGGIKRLFGIASPSRVMAGLGANMVSGLVRGLITNAGSLRAVIKSIGGNIVDWFGGIFGGLGQGGTSGNLQKLAQRMAAGYGWTGAQWTALRNLVQNESGWNPNAQNPTSTAYGLFQFLDSTWAGVGATKTSSPVGQIAAGLRYIKQRYGSPLAAWSAWLSRSPHWYGTGVEGIFAKPTLIGVGERGPEAVSVRPLGRSGGGGIDYDALAAAIVRALREQPPVVAVDDIHTGLLAKKRRQGRVALGLD